MNEEEINEGNVALTSVTWQSTEEKRRKTNNERYVWRSREQDQYAMYAYINKNALYGTKMS